MKYNSAEANKLLKSLIDSRDKAVQQEELSMTFVAATVEDIEDVRPYYDIAESKELIAELDREIRIVKHAINQFNVSHVVDGFGMTVDEILVYIPQLTKRKEKYSAMIKRLPKTRKKSGYGDKSAFIEYEYANYDIADAEKEYADVSYELDRAHLALDKLNHTETMEIDLSEP